MLGAVLLAVVGVVVWSQMGVYTAEPGPLAAARADTDLRISEDGGSVVMTPTEPDDGASHASFGAYGPQDGDGTPTITLDEMTGRIAAEAAPFIDALRAADSGG